MFKATCKKVPCGHDRSGSSQPRIAALLIAATGSCDAGGFSDGHVRSGAADVRVDAAVGFGLTLYPVRRRSFNGRGVG